MNEKHLWGNRMKTKTILGICLLLLLFTGCAKNTYEPVKDIHNLEGRKVGVALPLCSEVCSAQASAR